MTTAVVVGSGPNGLAAAVRLAQAGISVTVLESADRPGGGTRTTEYGHPGVLHDDCSAFHPTGVVSPFLKSLPLQDAADTPRSLREQRIDREPSGNVFEVWLA